jgi:outer membrane protein TolC
MEQLARRAQAVLAAQHYFDAKQVTYSAPVAELGVNVAEETLAVLRGRLQQQQAFVVEVQQAEVDLGKARVNLAAVQRQLQVTQRQLGVTLHRSRLLAPQEQGPFLIEPQQCYQFMLDHPDTVELGQVPDFPRCREEAIAMAKRQRYEVRILVEGVAIARLQQQRSWLRLLGLGSLPFGLANRESTGATSLGLVFGSVYEFPAFDIGLWANIKRAKLDLIRSELDLERGLMDAARDAGDAWDRLVLTEQEYQQRLLEEALAREQYERQKRRYQSAQVIKLEVLGAGLNHQQAVLNQWTAWYNLQISRLDVLRATELFLPYVERLARAPPDGAPLAGPNQGPPTVERPEEAPAPHSVVP